MTTATLTTNDPLRMLTVREASELLRVSKTTLYEWMGEGRLRSLRIDGSRRIPYSALAEFVSRAS